MIGYIIFISFLLALLFGFISSVFTKIKPMLNIQSSQEYWTDQRDRLIRDFGKEKGYEKLVKSLYFALLLRKISIEDLPLLCDTLKLPFNLNTRTIMAVVDHNAKNIIVERNDYGYWQNLYNTLGKDFPGEDIKEKFINILIMQVRAGIVMPELKEALEKLL